VLSAFIIESKQMLEQDPADVMVDALIFFINNTANGTHMPYPRASFSPPSFAVSVNCLFFASLSASIVAALASVVSLQWVAEYDAAVSRSGSSPEDRVKRRQFRYGGMEQWQMKEIIAALPIFLYFSLVLFFSGLAQWMWNVHSTVGGVVLGGALLGGTFYLVTTLLAVVFPSSPFRAPIVRWIYVSFHYLFHSFAKMEGATKVDLRASEELPSREPFPERINEEGSSGSSEPSNSYESISLGRANEEVLSRSPDLEQRSEKDRSGSPFFKRLTDYLTRAWNTANNIHTYQKLVLYIPSIFTHVTIQERDQVRIDSTAKALVSDSLAWLAENISISSDSHDRLLLLADEATRLDAEQQSSKKFKKIPWNQIFHLLGSKYVQDAASKDLTVDDEKSLGILLRCLRNPRIGQVIAPGKTEEYSDIQPDKNVISEADFEGVDPVYLLLRNIKIPEQTLSIEQQVALRVDLLNQIRHLPRHPREIAALQRDLTSKGWEDMLDEFIPLLSKDIELHAHENEQDRVDNLISLVHLKKLPLQTIPLEIKGWYPVFFISQPSILYYRLSCINWIYSGINNRHIHSIFKALLAAQRRDPQVNLLWRFIANDEEIDAALALSSPQDRSELSDRIREERNGVYIARTLEGLDQLVAQGCDEDQRATMIGLLCNELAKISTSLYKGYLPVRTVKSLRDPWIRLVGYAVAGINERIGPSSSADLEVPKFLKENLSKYFLSDTPFIHPSILPRLRMRFWRNLDVPSTRGFIGEALKDVEKLVSEYKNDFKSVIMILETTSSRLYTT
jgi:hypothetical protein